jgi:hypothetical protein
MRDVRPVSRQRQVRDAKLRAAAHFSRVVNARRFAAAAFGFERIAGIVSRLARQEIV